MIRSLCVVAMACAAAACGGAGEKDHAPPDQRDGAAPSAEGSAEGAVPMDTLLRQFQSRVPPVTTLHAASPTRDALTRRYLDALASRDTGALRQMHISRAEYAYVYFPSSRMMAPPYDLPPDVAWMLHTSESNTGVRSVLRRFGGQRLQFRGVRCPGPPLREGANVVWRDCVVRYRGDDNREAEHPLFAAIIERAGQFKFFSYATPL